jgi:hypothetical protein
LNEVRREKAQLEKVIEQEHLSNLDLQSKLSDIRDNKKTEDSERVRPTRTNNNHNDNNHSLDSLTESLHEEEEEDSLAEI